MREKGVDLPTFRHYGGGSGVGVVSGKGGADLQSEDSCDSLLRLVEVVVGLGIPGAMMAFFRASMF